jgi:hypothetical protein
LAEAEHYHHWSEQHLEPGTLIKPGRWGRIVKSTGPLRHPLFYRETLTELVRRLEYVERPSRLAAAYVWADLAFARSIRPGAEHHLYEVRAPDGLELFDETWIGLMRGAVGFAELVDCARRYWSGEVRNPDRREGLTLGPLLVLGAVEGPRPTSD